MSVNKAVHKLNVDLSHLKTAQARVKTAQAKVAKARAGEKTALKNIASQEKAIIDQFQAGAVDPADQQKLLTQLFGLGQKDVQTRDTFAKRIAADSAAVSKDKKAVTADHKKALKDLKPAEYHLGLKATNHDRALLGLKALKKPVRQTGTTGSPWKKGPGTLHGADTSHYQSNATFERSIKNAKWTGIKATQGTGYTDPNFKARWAELGRKVKSGSMKLRMAYCFLDKGNGEAQAKHFLNVLGVHGKLPAGTRLTLDWEGAALQSPSTLHAAASYIHKVTGTWPVVYVQGSMLAVAKRTVPHAPLWEAAYGEAVNRSVPFFQYSDGPGYDHDVFNGNLKALEKFAGWS